MIHPRRSAAGLLAAFLISSIAGPARLLAGSAGASASDDVAAAREGLLGSLAQIGDEKEMADRLLLVGFISPETAPAQRTAARELAATMKPRILADRSVPQFDRMTPDGQAALLRLYDTVYPNIRGFSYGVSSVIARGTGSPYPAVRQAADELAGKFRIGESYFPLRRRCNRSHGADRVRAIETIGRLADGRAAWFLPDLLDDAEPGVRDATYEALRAIGRPGTLALKERLVSHDPRHRLLALKALMPQAVVDDLPTLYEFASANPGLDPALKEELFALIARLEVERDQGVETGS